MATATIDLHNLFKGDTLDADALQKLWAKATKKHGEGAGTLTALGLSLDAGGFHAQAIRTFERALEAEPSNAEALFRLAYANELHGSPEAALSCYEKLGELSKPHAGALINYGLLLEDEGRYEEAIEVYQRVLAADPTHNRARMFLKDAEASVSMYYDEEQARRSDRRNAILRIPISDFELSVRARNCLNKMNIRTLGDLVIKSEEELLSYKNFGETSLTEIKQLLAQKGLQLGMYREGGAGQPRTAFAASPAAAPAAAAAAPEQPALPNEILSKPIGDLDLSVRSRNCMERLGVRTIGQLCERSEPEMLAVKNFGQTSLNEVRQKLAVHGLALRQG
jgi:DNA-directed RNA polymerase subunit alpha